MSQYTTGELAKACGVTVRTVQFYDQKGILIPSALTEGGRRLYSEDDLKRMKIICFLRDTGLSLDTIGKLLEEEDPGSVISIFLEQQEQVLREEIGERQEQMNRLEELKKEIKNTATFSIDSIGDIATIMENKKRLSAVHRNMLLTMIDKFGGGPVGLDTLAATTGEDAGTIEAVYEPFLMQLGFLMRTPRGRICTLAAYQHMGRIPPASLQGQMQMSMDEV